MGAAPDSQSLESTALMIRPALLRPKFAATPGTKYPDLQLIIDLQAEIGRVLGPLLDGERRAALMDFPASGNDGDNAMCFPYNRMVQLPQTLCFRDPANLEKTGAELRRHPVFTTLVRDHRSLDITTNQLRMTAQLGPDMAFCLGTLRHTAQPDYDVVMIQRRDQESQRALPEPLGRSVLRADWPSDSLDVGLLTHRALAGAEKHLGLGPLLHGLRTRFTRSLAEGQLRTGMNLLRARREVVTDRLQGHILGVSLGIPHLFIVNSYGKNRGFFEAWTSLSQLVRWLDWDDGYSQSAAA